MPVLYRIQEDGLLSEPWEIGENPLVVGRGEFAEASVTDDALSRSHFLVVREGVDYFVVDLDSQNGTWVNGKRVAGCKLHSGEIIKAGQSLFYFSRTPVGTPVLPQGVVLPQVEPVPVRAEI